VSPGLTPELVAAARGEGLPLLPGVSTASEVMMGLELGLERFKLFPAVPVGGVELLKALYGPIPHARFCPTGGISLETAGQFLALPNVSCVGGSWLAPVPAMEAGDWATIEQIARDSIARVAA